MGAALFHVDGVEVVPSELTAGPWSPDAQHGGPVAALLARTCEGVAAGDGVEGQVVRLTVELVRPVPLTPLVAEARLVRPGKKVRLIDASLRAGGREVAKARALWIRTVGVPVPSPYPERPVPPLPDFDAAPTPAQGMAEWMGYVRAVDLRYVHGSWETLGPATVWVKLVADVVEGEPPSPLQRVAAAADFGNGLSAVVPFATHTFINPDLTVALSRTPQGAWVGLDVVTRLAPDGFGQAEGTIFDTAGAVGRAVQSLLVEGRDG